MVNYYCQSLIWGQIIVQHMAEGRLMLFTVEENCDHHMLTLT